jgi:hypothetical protein
LSAWIEPIGWETIVIGSLVGATLGALTLAFGRVFWNGIDFIGANVSSAGVLSLILIYRLFMHNDWAMIRSGAWFWLAIGPVSFMAASVVGVLQRTRWGGIDKFATYLDRLAMPLGILGMLYCLVLGSFITTAVLLGQVGRLLGGPLGREIGETVGVPLHILLVGAGLFGTMQAQQNPAGLMARLLGPRVGGVFIFLVLPNAGVLWLMWGPAG